MKYLTWGQPQETYPVAILIKQSALRKSAIESSYINMLESMGVKRERVIVISVAYNESNKAPVKLIKEYLSEELLPTLRDLKTKYVYCADGPYFKELTKLKMDANFGNIHEMEFDGHQLCVTPGVNHQVLLFDESKREKVGYGIKAIVDHASGQYRPVGKDLLKSVEYIRRDEVEKAREALAKLHQYDEIACDIEGFSLSMFDSGVATIGFAYSEHDAVQIQCDYRELPEPEGKLLGYFDPCPEMYAVLREFFESYKGRIAYHRANHDVKVLIYTLYMEHDLDKIGMHRGMEVFFPGMDDTKIIAYLALNTTGEVSYGLKDLGQQHAGDWSEGDIKDIRLIPLDKLMKYNAVDAVTTLWVKHKYYPIMVADQQETLYKGLMLESLETIIQMELVGMPMSPAKLEAAEQQLNKLRDNYFNTVMSQPEVALVEDLIQHEAMRKHNAKLKTIQHPIDKYRHIRFNPNSGDQLARLLHEVLQLPILDTTATGKPSTGGDTLEKLIKHPAGAVYKDLLKALIDLSAVEKVISAFIPAFKAGRLKADGMIYLHGSFNLGGTISGRLSSSDPNMQNMPAGSTYGKLVKSIFMAAVGYLFGGADFAALEDRINALLTRDPNKIKVYTGLLIYKLTINGVDHHIREDATIVYDGKTYTGKEFYEAHRSV